MTSSFLILVPMFGLVAVVSWVAMLCIIWCRKQIDRPVVATQKSGRLISEFIVVVTVIPLAMSLLFLLYQVIYFGIMLCIYGQNALEVLHDGVKERQSQYQPTLRNLAEMFSYAVPQLFLVYFILWPVVVDVAESVGISKSRVLRWGALWGDLGDQKEKMLERLMLFSLLGLAAWSIGGVVDFAMRFLSDFFFYDWVRGDASVDFVVSLSSLLAVVIAVYPFIAIGLPLIADAFRNLGAVTEAPRVYISYAWSEEGFPIDELVESLRARLYDVRWDKESLGFRESISAFMQEIGRGHCIIAIIGKEYLSSKACMTELLEVHRNRDFHDRLVPIVLDGTDIFSREGRSGYIDSWIDRRDLLSEQIAKYDRQSVCADGAVAEREEIQQILNQIDRLLAILVDMNLLNERAVTACDFAIVEKAVYDRLSRIGSV